MSPDLRNSFSDDGDCNDDYNNGNGKKYVVLVKNIGLFNQPGAVT